MKIAATGELTGRAIPEWVGATPDAKIPDRVIIRISLRQEGKCAITGVKLRAGHFHADHIKPLKKGGRHRESNLQLITDEAHALKTAEEAGEQAKVNRIIAKRLGLKKPRNPLPGSRLSSWRKRLDGTVERR